LRIEILNEYARNPATDEGILNLFPIHFEILKPKSQKTNNSQASKPNTKTVWKLLFGTWKLFVI